MDPRKIYATSNPTERTVLKFQYIAAVTRAPNLTRTAQRVANLLVCEFMNNSDKNPWCGCAWPSQERLAVELGCSKRMIQIALNELAKGNWLSVKRTQHNIYTPNWSRVLQEMKSGSSSKAQSISPPDPEKEREAQCVSPRSEPHLVSDTKCNSPYPLEEPLERTPLNHRWSLDDIEADLEKGRIGPLNAARRAFACRYTIGTEAEEKFRLKMLDTTMAQPESVISVLLTREAANRRSIPSAWRHLVTMEEKRLSDLVTSIEKEMGT